MRLLILGDPAAGKSTTTRLLQERFGIPGVFEEARFGGGHSRIPPEVEADKLQAILYFNHYYHERDKSWLNKSVILEYCLQFQHPFIESQFRAAKITAEQRAIAHTDVARREPDVLLATYDLACYLLIPNDIIRERYEQQRLLQTPDWYEYCNYRREESLKYFSARMPFEVIDGVLTTSETVVATIEGLLTRHGMNKSLS